MNCPTRDPDPSGVPGHSQSPSRFSNELVTNKSLNSRTDSYSKSRKTGSAPSSDLGDPPQDPIDIVEPLYAASVMKDHSISGSPRQNLAASSSSATPSHEDGFGVERVSHESTSSRRRASINSLKSFLVGADQSSYDGIGDDDEGDIDDERLPFVERPSLDVSWKTGFRSGIDRFINAFKRIAGKYSKFIGPGIMVSVAYMDPGNYSTAVSAGAQFEYKLLFVVLVSNLFAVFLQTLCVKLGSVTGLDLAQNCREHLPRWLCIVIYLLAEIAIIATDLAEVVGTAISLNILFNIPLVVGVALTVIDVLLVLMAYRPNGPMKIVRYFEYLVSALVFLVVICFAIELANIGPVNKGDIFRGFLPSKELFETQGIYLSCGILGATVMPHSLYLGSGLVQPRLREYDQKKGYTPRNEDPNDDILKYRPSIHAIKYAMKYSIAELIISLFTVAIFVNSAILIVAGATLSHSPDAVDADLFSIYEMLRTYLSPAAGTVFALALLFSGQSAGIVCTLSGQMVSEGFLHWSFQPWIRRLFTRALAIAPCMFVAIFVGRKGLADVLNASQVVLSLLLPFVSAPLLYFTCKKSIMQVPIVPERFGPEPLRSRSSTLTSFHYDAPPSQAEEPRSSNESAISSIVMPEFKDMSNSWLTNATAVVIFALVSALNLFLIISMAFGADVHM